MKISAGMTRAAPPANLSGSGETLIDWSRKAVSVRFWIVSTAAAKTSFQEITKANTAEAAIPGSASGRTTLRNACTRVQPRVQAASSSSTGMPEKSEKVMRTAKGSASVVWTRARPRIVSSSPVRMKSTARGSARSGSGKARVMMTRKRNASLPGKSNRESA